MKNKKRRHWAEIKKKENRFKKINYSKIIYRLLSIIFIGVVVYSFIFSTFLEISSVSIIGLNKISAKKAYQLIDELKSGKYFGIVPKNNFLFLRSKKIVQQFEDKFKRIDTMEVIKKFPHKLEIRINERNTLLIVCSGGNCYFVDKKGVAYAKANLNSEEVKQNRIVKLVDESNKKIEEGDDIFSKDFVEFLTNISGKIKNSLNIILLNEYRTKSLVSEEIIVQTNRGWDIYLSSKFPLEKSIQMLKILLDKQLTLKESNNLEYVDLRSENKIFYRIKGDASIEENEIKEKENDKENNNIDVEK